VSTLAETVPRVAPLNDEAVAEALEELDKKTKPRGSLGRLESLATQLCGIAGTIQLPPIRATIVVAAADHGYAAEGVSAYPVQVTRQMLGNVAAGGAAIAVLARELDAELVVVDAGVGAPTLNATRGPAMSREAALRWIEAGITLADELANRGVNVVVLGELGIGNTTAASALHARLLGVSPETVCGPGTGLDPAGVHRKARVVARALEANPDSGDGVDALAALGGFEIAVLTGVAIGAAARRVVVVLDGFVVCAAALVAAALAPASVRAMVASHVSTEPGHVLGLRSLGLEPLLALRLRLGEGTGGALALPVLRAARAILVEMATFGSAGVTDAGA
jgi:nicotinate-nucleotide--dimethylbenzimidazole phosphoribosyltransferase